MRAWLIRLGDVLAERIALQLVPVLREMEERIVARTSQESSELQRQHRAMKATEQRIRRLLGNSTSTNRL